MNLSVDQMNPHMPHVLVTKMGVLLTSQCKESQHDTHRHVAGRRHICCLCARTLATEPKGASASTAGQGQTRLQLLGPIS